MSLRITARGHGPARLAWLHGLFGQGRNFNTVAGMLDEAATSLLIDLPNHGRSSWTDRFDYDLFADLVAIELRSGYADSRPVVLLGHSMGGKIAMRLALRHPELIQGLVVIDIAPIARQETTEFANYIDALLDLDLASLPDRRAADEILRTAIPNPTTRAFLLQNLDRESAGGWRWLANLPLLRAGLARLAGWPETNDQWAGPVLWLVGQQSDFVSRQAEPAMRRYFPETHLVEIPDAGHWVHADQPRAVAAAIAGFLARLESQDRH